MVLPSHCHIISSENFKKGGTLKSRNESLLKEFKKLRRGIDVHLKSVLWYYRAIQNSRNARCNSYRIVTKSVLVNTVYFQIENSHCYVILTQPHSCWFVCAEALLKYSLCECVSIVQQYFCLKSYTDVQTSSFTTTT